jgi:NAD(P)-dependent dehydrogenase (short-subunit alcohol dehydrogenase family)
MNGIESMFRLDGRLALVTGASSGLGRHFALTLARAGARVAVASRRFEALQTLVQEIQALGGQALALPLDVADAAGVRACFDRLAAEAGVAEVLVNNAGTTITKPLLHQTEADWDQVVDTNLKGAWLVATEAARRLVETQRPGSIVNIASILAERQAGGVAPYAISKAGMVQATKSMALELARHGIRVNALLPGYVVTDLNRAFLQSEAGQKLRARIPSRRFNEPEDLDGALLLLASDAGRAISGATLAVDGAHLVSSL